MTRVALAPAPEDYAVEAVRRGGGTLVGLDDEPEGLVWTLPERWDDIGPALDRAPDVRWVQLPFAGVEEVVAAGVLRPGLAWTCAKGVYSEPVAEHALALALAALRSVPAYARTRSWGEQSAVTLYDAPVVAIGGGGITSALLRLLEPFRASVTVVRRDPDRQVPGAARTIGLDRLDDALEDGLVVVLALALTPETERVIDADRLRRMRPEAVLVNVARGRHVDTDALVDALRAGRLGAAALDVTDPEPLPDGHPLWDLPTCLVTPHTANPWATAQPLLARRVEENVRRFAAGDDLLGVVDLDAGY